jgi:DNA-binding MarR family transcriptional regulator
MYTHVENVYLHGMVTSQPAPAIEPWPADLPADMPRCYARLANMAARAVNRHYNAGMRASGLPITQIAVLAAIRANRWSSLTALADDLVLERTTLLRNLTLLERDGFIEPEPASGGHGKRYRLTGRGFEGLAAALPHWRRAQDAITQALGPERAGDIGRALTTLRRAATTLADAAGPGAARPGPPTREPPP